MSLKVLDSAKFLCEPRNITIEVKYNYTGTITINLKLNDKSALSIELRSDIIPKKEEDYHSIIKQFCNMLINLKEDDLYNICEHYMMCLNIHRNLKKVINRSGLTIWSRN